MIGAGALMVIETETSSRGIPENSVSMSSSVSIGDALAADLAQDARVVGVQAHQRRHVERRREPRLPVFEQVAEALVGLRRGAEPRELAHRPQPPPIHRGYTPRVNGNSPGTPMRSSNGPTSSGPYSGRTGSPDSVVNVARRSGWAP